MEAMLGFHEDDEDPGFELLEEDDIPVETVPVAGPSKPRPRPPVSAPACSPPLPVPSEGKADVPNPKGKNRARAKSIGTHGGESSSTGMDPEIHKSERQPNSTLECPICQKKLQTDNQGLNAHIDFCLSRGAIWDAQAETVGPKKDSATKVKAKEKFEIFGKESKGSKASGLFAWGNASGKTGKRKHRDT
jgi:DNA polymerase kappa